MSHPDYEQYSQDHAALLVLVRSVGSQLKQKQFGRIFDKICRVSSVKVTDSSGQVRTIYVRYVKEHPLENNDWGDFQTHRRLLGLITVSRYDSQPELNEICRVHESLKVKYTSTLFDSRCILFGPAGGGGGGAPVPAPEGEVDAAAHFTTPTNFKARALFYTDGDSCADLEAHTADFVNSLFWVLESKRLERSREKLERVPLLLAPFEKKDFVGLDMESRNNRKRCTGRMTKHLGDLCLQAGLVADSLAYYTGASDTLKAINDFLWLGAAYEGLCAASALLLYPHVQRRGTPLQRNTSLQEGSPTKRAGAAVVAAPELTTTPSPPPPPPPLPPPPSLTSTVTATTMTTTSNSAGPVAHALTAEELARRYRDAIIHYSKYKNAGIVETEASFKAARLSIVQGHGLQAASFLQNVVFINLTLSEQEKVQRFETLTALYAQMGFARKAAFCRRLAATRHVSPQNPAPNWPQCYALMLQSLDGHQLSLEPLEAAAGDTSRGWPALHVQLLQELVVAAKRMGHPALATRHTTFLLQALWPHLGAIERKELAIQLQTLAAQCEGAPVPLVLDSGQVIPPANLTRLPQCTLFQPRSLQPHRRPHKWDPPAPAKPDAAGPFLFTPIHFGAWERRDGAGDAQRAKGQLDFQWVQDDVCEVCVRLVNPLPFELRVSDMRLLTAGPVFEALPESLLLPPADTPTLVTLRGVPRESGALDLLGYSTHALGVKSNCRLRHMAPPFSLPFPPQYGVEVVPALPVLDVKTSVPQSASFAPLDNVVTSASLSLHHGESAECTLTLTNAGALPVERVDVALLGVGPALPNVFTWMRSQLDAQLPLAPGASATLTVLVHAVATGFLAGGGGGGSAPDGSSGMYSGGSLMSVSAGGGGGGGPSSLPSRLHSPSTMGGSFRSTSSVASCRSPGALSVPAHSATSIVEGQLQLRYGGGPGLAAGYCRTCSVYMTLETLPSLQVTNWDVLPAETSDQFYLVLDVANLTTQEMDLQYTDNKHMVIEGQESCRVPVPVERCPLSKLAELHMERAAAAAAAAVDQNLLELDRLCSEHIVERVELRWQLLATEARGCATLRGLSLSPAMLDLVRMAPLQWEVRVDAAPVRPQADVCCRAGERVQLVVSVRNVLERPLRHLTLTIHFYQDHQNGVTNCRLETRLAIAGASRLQVPALPPHGSVQHTCHVLFFTAGQYKADIECTAPECLGAGPSTGHHLWKFIPPLQISVCE